MWFLFRWVVAVRSDRVFVPYKQIDARSRGKQHGCIIRARQVQRHCFPLRRSRIRIPEGPPPLINTRALSRAAACGTTQLGSLALCRTGTRAHHLTRSTPPRLERPVTRPLCDLSGDSSIS